ncbi:hypothetical protein PO002_33945 [Cupriavidus necator]|uniref:hypothetical protein n=1 Tax=Cupriavidus necator TaxID=106590 RepID=UPI0039C39274
MSRPPLAIPRQPVMTHAQDYYRLRREGIGFIEQMAGAVWTDYNTHDPGITLLEGVCYVLTDLANRVGWEISDLLTPAAPAVPGDPYPGQAFFTAGRILGVNPVTPDDLRRLMIDQAGIHNAWAFCKSCACELNYYMWCDNGALVLSYARPGGDVGPVRTVGVLGLYEVLLEMEGDGEAGDLNDRKIELSPVLEDADGKSFALKIELRPPAWDLAMPQEWTAFLQEGEVASLKVLSLGATPSYDVLADPALDDAARDQYLRAHWNQAFYMSVEVTLARDGARIPVRNVALHLFGDQDIRMRTRASALSAALEDASAAGFVQRHRARARKVSAALDSARRALAAHRNLGEDFCRIRGVDTEDIAVCADLEVAPDADIERVQADAWFAIEQYFNPALPRHSAQALVDAGVPVEDVFNGPVPGEGFVRADDLAAASLRTVLYTSDLTSRLMKIEGVQAIHSLLLSKYDDAGNLVSGAADPVEDNGTLVFDPGKTSAAWQLHLGEQRVPRLYFSRSRFLFHKNGLPFLAHQDEAADTLLQLRVRAEPPQPAGAPADLPAPAGTFCNAGDYYPLQYSFPLNYGIGHAGLPARASALRQAQARQLKAYLMVFEQLLANAFAQLAHVGDLFSLEPAVSHTYFAGKLDASVIRGYDEVVGALSGATLDVMTETPQVFQSRRNRFLDHLLARFGEDYAAYTLLQTGPDGTRHGPDQLIADKIAFLQAYPLVSRDRGRAFDYTQMPRMPDNAAGLEARIRLLLGLDSEARTLLVEHVLLRPKFAGDALWPACTEGGCDDCSDADPYSFRLSLVMPGWVSPWADDLALRAFGDRTIREETPSHLLAKICWVGNDGFVDDPCDPVVDEIAGLLQAQGLTPDGKRPQPADACDCARAIQAAFAAVFRAWYEDKVLDELPPDVLQGMLEAEFATRPDPASNPCTTVLDTALFAEIRTRMVAAFRSVALNGWQFERIEQAWHAWLDANAAFRWEQERLPERVQAILAAGALPDAAGNGPADLALCECAAGIVTRRGIAFHDWMEANIAAGNRLDAFTVFSPQPVVLCEGMTFLPDTGARIQALLDDRYAAYRQVSYWLRILVRRLARLRNVYPGATLHDCDEGSDVNPVRLGSTALGRAGRKGGSGQGGGPGEPDS